MPNVHNNNTYGNVGEWFQVGNAQANAAPVHQYWYNTADDTFWFGLSPGDEGLHWKPTGTSNPDGAVQFQTTWKSGLTRSSSARQDPTYQIEVLATSLGRELADQEASISEIATKLEVLEESCTLIRSHISSLRKVASLLQTSSQKKPQKSQPNFGLAGAGFEPAIAQAHQFAAFGAAQVEPVPLLLDPE